MTRAIRIAEPVSQEFSEAVRWYEARRSGLGAEFFDAVSESFARIASKPELASQISRDGKIRRLLVTNFPYQVVFSVATDEVVIVAVAHQKRRPGYWRNRIR